MDKEPAGAEKTGAETPEAESIEDFTDADAEAAFAIGLGEPASEEPEGTTDGASAPEGTETTGNPGPKGEAEPGTKTGDTETPGDGKGEGDLSSKPSYEDLEKQLNDTKAWGTAMAQQIADLKKQTPGDIPETPAKEGRPAEEQIPEEVQDYLKDYPEAQKAIDFFAQQLLKKTLGDLNPSEIQQTISGMQDQINQTNFEKAVVTGFRSPAGPWVDGHPDAYKIMATPEYTNWFNAEIKRDPTIGSIADPKQAIDVLTRYKTHMASSAAAAHDAEHASGVAQDVKDMAAGAIPPGTQQGSQSPGKKDEDKSPEEIFEQHAT